MTALYTPEGVAPAAVVGGLAARKIVIAGGLHKEIKTKYVRFGHMGTSAVNQDADVLIEALQGVAAELKDK